MQHRYRVTNRFYVALAALMAVIFGASFFVARGRLAITMRALDAKKADRSAAAAEVAALSDRLAYTQTDQYVERAARDELGLIYPGEVRYVGNQ